MMLMGIYASGTLHRACFFDAVIVYVPVSGEDEPLGWVESAGGFDEDYIAGHVVMDDGSIVVAGEFTSAIMFDDTGLGSVGINGDKDAFIASMNTTGNWTGAINFGSTGDDGINAITLFPSGDIFVVGFFCFGTAGEACEMNISSFTLSKDDDNGEGDAFVGEVYNGKRQRNTHLGANHTKCG